MPAQVFQGNITGNAATVTTNANLTGDVTSVGNATTIKEAPSVKAITLNPGSEIIVNGDMELTTGWSPSGTPVVSARSDEQAHTGTYSRKITGDSAYDGMLSTAPFTTTVGHVYLATAWVYGDGIGKAFMEFYDGTTEYYGPRAAAGVGYVYPASWTQEQWIFVAAQTSATTKFQFSEGSGAVSGTWYVDDVSLKEIPATVNGNLYLTSNVRVVIPTFANNAAAIAGGLVAGQFYRVNAATDPEPLYIVH